MLDVQGELAGHKRSLTCHLWFSRPGHPVLYSHVCMHEIHNKTVTTLQKTSICGSGIAYTKGGG